MELHDSLAPQPEAKNWPPEDWRLAIPLTFGLLHFKLEIPL